MTTEEKNILIKELAIRLPYNPRLLFYGNVIELNYSNFQSVLSALESKRTDGEGVILFLKPLSDAKDLIKSFNLNSDKLFRIDDEGNIICRNMNYLPVSDCSEVMEFFNRNHIDYKNLITKGLAKPYENIFYYYDTLSY